MDKKIVKGICKNNKELIAQAGTDDFFHNEKCKGNCLPINVEGE